MTEAGNDPLFRLNYQEFGQGRPVLLLHGWGISFPIWRELIPLIRQQFRIIVPELPGIGKSPLPAQGPYYDLTTRALEELRVKLGIESWIIVGYSLGGWAARNYARRWPSRVSFLTYLCVAKPLAANSASLNILFRIDKVFQGFGAWCMSGWRLHALIDLLGFSGKKHPLANEWFREITSQPLQAIKRSIRDLPAWGQGTLRLPQVRMAFLWGSTDRIGVPPLFPGPLDRILKGPHALPMTNPVAVAEALNVLLKSEERATASRPTAGPAGESFP